MCQDNYNIKRKKFEHLNYEQRRLIENWINNLPRPMFGFKTALEIVP